MLHGRSLKWGRNRRRRRRKFHPTRQEKEEDDPTKRVKGGRGGEVRDRGDFDGVNTVDNVCKGREAKRSFRTFEATVSILSVHFWIILFPLWEIQIGDRMIVGSICCKYVQ